MEITGFILIGFIHEVFPKNRYKQMGKEVDQTVSFSASEAPASVTGSMGHARHSILGKYSSILHLYCMVCWLLTLIWYVDSIVSNFGLTLAELNWFEFQFYFSNLHKFGKWMI